MSQLGQTNFGFTFTVNPGAGWGDLAGGVYTVPSPGILISDIWCYVGNGGTSQNCRFYIWQDAGGGKPGTWLIRGTNTFTLSSLGLFKQAGLSANSGAGITSDLYLPAGTKIWIGVYCSAGSEQIEAAGASGGGTEIGNTSDGNWSDHGPASLGQMCAYVDYAPLPAPSLTSVSPSTAAAGQTVTLTGSHLLHTSSITVCGVAATSYTITSDTSITLTIPSGAAGTGTIVVTTPAGSDSLAFTAGSLYADSGAAFAGGVLVYADDETTWQQAEMWADDGTTWHQIG